MLDKLPRPIIFAHRGASAYAPENTLPAFKFAINHGADAIELDVKLSADGKVVVFHDQTLKRITGKPGKVKDYSLDELRTLDAGSHFGQSFRGEPIPMLEEVFELIGEQSYYNIELTNYSSLNDPLPELVAEIILNYKITDRVLISSFNPLALLRIRRKLSGIPLALLARPGRKGALARSRLGFALSYQAIHVALRDVTQVIIKRTHQRHCRIHVYTVNQKDKLRHIIEMGVDGVITDDPTMAKEVLNNLVHSKL